MSLKLKSSIKEEDKSSKFDDEFYDTSIIGSGGFGTVFKAKHRLDDKIYAVKRVKFGEFSDEKKQKIMREVNSLVQLKSEFVVEYYDSWLEGNYLYIHMEFCSQTLECFLKDKAIAFNRKRDDQINHVFEYFISCEIFKQLLECVQYLHQSYPIIIHRDLKLENILIDDNIRPNYAFIKLCDFGLAIEHHIKRNNVSCYGYSFAGTPDFGIAPEIRLGQPYNHKADIYNLGLIGQYIFDITLNASRSFVASESIHRSYIQSIYEILKNMKSDNYKERPECYEVLDNENKWYIPMFGVESNIELNTALNTLNSKDNIFNKILHHKLPWRYSSNILLNIIPAKYLRSATTTNIKMDAKPRGVALIFVNKLDLYNEAEQFGSIWEQLLFTPAIYRGLTRGQIVDVLSPVAKSKDNYRGDAFVMMFIGHGFNERIIGWSAQPQWPPADDTVLPIKNIVDMFSETRCRALRQKTKVFVFNCCREKWAEEALPLQYAQLVYTGSECPKCLGSLPCTKCEPTMIDTLQHLDPQWKQENKQTNVIYACAEGLKAWYDQVNGPIGHVSVFGQALSHTIAQYSWYKSLYQLFLMSVKRLEEELEKSGDSERRPEIKMFAVNRELFFNPGQWREESDDLSD